MGSWLERFYSCCTSADWCWWPNTRKLNPAAASGSDDDDDALIEGSPAFGSSNGIAMLSRGKIKYVKAGVVASHTGTAHIGIPIIDPLIGQDYNGAMNQQHRHQRQLFTQIHQNARLLVNKNIFQWHQQTHHHHHHHQQQQQQHQWWWESSTPPSSVDLEWEHEGLMPPVMESGSEGGGADDHDDEDDDDNDDDYDTADEERDGKMGAVDGRAASIGRISRNDSPVHRSPSPSSACHSLEWDSNGDDFFGHEPPPLPIHTSLPK